MRSRGGLEIVQTEHAAKSSRGPRRASLVLRSDGRRAEGRRVRAAMALGGDARGHERDGSICPERPARIDSAAGGIRSMLTWSSICSGVSRREPRFDALFSKDISLL